MKLHNLVSDPNKLEKYGKYISDEQAYENLEKGDNNDPRLVKVVASDPEFAYFYARNIIKGRWPEGEKAIASDPENAYYYAIDVIKGRWPKGEKAIASNPRYATNYKEFLRKKKKKK